MPNGHHFKFALLLWQHLHTKAIQLKVVAALVLLAIGAAEDGNGWPALEVLPGVLALVCPLPILAAIKRSHIIFTVQWKKHMGDFHGMQALLAAGAGDFSRGSPSETALEVFVKQRRAEGEARYGKHRVHLDVPNEAFFPVWYLQEFMPEDLLAKALAPGKTVYTHDELHEIVVNAHTHGLADGFCPAL